MKNEKVRRVNIMEVAINLREDVVGDRIQNLYFFINKDNELMKTDNKNLIPIESDNIDCTHLLKSYYEGEFDRPSAFVKMVCEEINLMIDTYNIK